MNNKTFFAFLAIALSGTAVNTAYAEMHVANDRNGVPGLSVSINDARIRHSGDEIVFYPIFQQTGSKTVGLLSIDNNRYCSIDGEDPIYTYMPYTQIEVPSDGEPFSSYVEMKDVPIDARTITRLKIVGRAPYSAKSTDNNYYGDFDYTFTGIPIPQFKTVAPDAAKGTPGGMFTDNELELGVVSSQKENGSLYVTFTLTNTGKSSKHIEPKEGYATTAEGDRLTSTVKIPATLDPGDTVKGVLTVAGGADESIRSIKHNFYVGEKEFNWHPQLILK